jgi:hypothetical protein
MGRVWHPIDAAPADVDLELSIHDNAEYHALAFPRRRDDSVWRDVRPSFNVAGADPLADLGSSTPLTVCTEGEEHGKRLH